MNHFLIIPLVSTLSGCFIAWLLKKAIIRRLPLMLDNIFQQIDQGLFTEKDFQAVISRKSSFQKIRPVIEEHINDFLVNRLGKEMPVIGMFVGDKTIAQFRVVFMKELEEIFPLVMDRYASDIFSGVNFREIMTHNPFSKAREKILPLIHASAAGNLDRLMLGGAIAGLVTGLLQLFILWLAS